MKSLTAIGCTCGRTITLPIGVGSFYGHMEGDTFSILLLLYTFKWQWAINRGQWYARCGQCVSPWPFGPGGNSRDRRRRDRAFGRAAQGVAG